jgi:hypothetical protein
MTFNIEVSPESWNSLPYEARKILFERNISVFEVPDGVRYELDAATYEELWRVLPRREELQQLGRIIHTDGAEHVEVVAAAHQARLF